MGDYFNEECRALRSARRQKRKKRRRTAKWICIALCLTTAMLWGAGLVHSDAAGPEAGGTGGGAAAVPEPAGAEDGAAALPPGKEPADPPPAEDKAGTAPDPSPAALSGESRASAGTNAALPPAGGRGAQSGDWQLLLVNPWNPMPKDYAVFLTQLKNGQAVDERCYPALQEMMDACRAAGLSPLICSSYRTWEKQESLYQKQVNKWLKRGCSEEEAQTKAGAAVAVPGTSEHQLGLAVDIVDVNDQNLDDSQADTAVQQWLMENCWDYGFILRYPADKSELTGIKYEPWHYRYVGKEAAAEIRALGVCLEEYLDGLK